MGQGMVSLQVDMHSTIYELIIQDHLLSQSPSMLVRPQYWLRAARKSRAPDVLAVDLRDRIFYLAEVTANQKPTQLLDKLEDYRDGEDRILGGLKYAFGVTGKWSVTPWLFIWEDLKEPLKTNIAKFGAKTTYLHSLIAPSRPGADALRKDWGLTADERATLLPGETGTQIAVSTKS